jgi:transposase-like protein
MDLTIEKLFSEEETLSDFVRKEREKKGIICPRCSCREHYYVKTIKQFTCKGCKRRTTLRSGTVMQSSKLPYKIWFQAFWYIAQSRKGISSKQMQRYLGIKRYRTVFELMHKIRNMMSQSELDRLSASIEGFVQSKLEMNIRDAEPGDKHQILIRNEKDDRDNYKISILAGADMNCWRPSRNARVSLARSHSWGLADIAKAEVVKADELSGWMQTHYSNLLKSIDGIYHGVSRKYRQLYLDEFSFKTNASMMKKDIFAELISCSLLRVWWQ